MLTRTRRILEDTVENYYASDSLTRGAAIAFYSVTSLIPVLMIVIAIAGLAWGEEAARGAIVRELTGLIGSDGAKLIQGAIESAHNSGSTGFALVVGAIILGLTLSGVFGELQSALNAVWKVDDRAFSISRLLRGRAASIGLVIGLGFLLLVSLVIDAGISATSGYIDQHLRYGTVFLGTLNMAASFFLTWTLFAAIYKVLPDKPLDWRDVVFGALVTAIAFEGGKNLIGLYLRQQHSDFQLWHGRRARERVVMDLLFGADLLARRLGHQGVRGVGAPPPRTGEGARDGEHLGLTTRTGSLSPSLNKRG
jgi:membrane protein